MFGPKEAQLGQPVARVPRNGVRYPRVLLLGEKVGLWKRDAERALLLLTRDAVPVPVGRQTRRGTAGRSVAGLVPLPQHAGQRLLRVEPQTSSWVRKPETTGHKKKQILLTDDHEKKNDS